MPVATRRFTAKAAKLCKLGSATSQSAIGAPSVVSMASSVSEESTESFPSTPLTPAGKTNKELATAAETEILTQVVTPSPAKVATKKRMSPPKDEANPTISQKKGTKATAPVSMARAPPTDWQKIYSLVEELRQDRTAPCDHSGCEALPDPTEDPATVRFQVLISLMLSSQTKDAVVGAAVRHMQADGVLNVRSIAQMEAAVLQKYLEKVGFHNNKTKYIKAAVDILWNKYGGDIPPTAADMIQDLPGVGPKMAYICESVAWKMQSGIGVDTHMHRLFNLLKWVDTKNPEQTRVKLQSWLPKSYWADVNLLWVGFGQEVQQFKPKILLKALNCSRPAEALRLLNRCGLNYRKVGSELGLTEEIDRALGN